jgi:hypothetical protein
MLTLFQNEWDELMLETYALKQSLTTTRQELAQALYEVAGALPTVVSCCVFGADQKLSVWLSSMTQLAA